MKKSVSKNIQWLQFSNILNSFIRSQILFSACDLDLFSRLANNKVLFHDDLAKKLSISSYGLRVLAMGLIELGLIRLVRINHYSLTPLAKKYLIKQSEFDMRSFVRFVGAVQQKCCSSLTDSLRTGATKGLQLIGGLSNETLYQTLEKNSPEEKLFHKGMAAYTKATQFNLSSKVIIDLNNVLDVGGGDGSTLIRLAKKNQFFRGAIFDLPSVILSALNNIKRNRLNDRITSYPGDIFKDNLPKNFSAILLSHFVEIFDPKRINLIYKKCYEALPIKGKLYIWTITQINRKKPGIQAVKSSAYFLTTAGGSGMAYLPQEHVLWLKKIGFKIITVKTNRITSHTLLIAEKKG